MPSWLPWVFTAISLTGAFLNAKGRLGISSALWLVANTFWLCLDLSRELNAQAALYLAFIITNIIGLHTALKNRSQKPD